MAELTKARSMQPYIILYKTTLLLGVKNLPKVFTRSDLAGNYSHRRCGSRVSKAIIRDCLCVILSVCLSAR